MDDSNKSHVKPAPEIDLAPVEPAARDANPRPREAENRATEKNDASVSVLLKTFVVFYTIVSLVWIGFAWTGKRPLYSSGPMLRRIGETYRVEITLIREDREHLDHARRALAADRGDPEDLEVEELGPAGAPGPAEHGPPARDELVHRQVALHVQVDESGGSRSRDVRCRSSSR